MALQMTLQESDVGYSFAEAYAKVGVFRGDKDITLFVVSWYANAAARLAGKKEVLQKEYSATTSELTGDFVPALYTYLKTLPEFAGALDV